MENNTQSSLVIANTNITLMENAVRTVPSFRANTPIEAKVILSYDGLMNPEYIKHEPIKTKKAQEYLDFCKKRDVVPSWRENYDHDTKTKRFLPGTIEIAGKNWSYISEEVMESLGDLTRPHQLCFNMKGRKALDEFIAEGKVLDLALRKGYKVQEGYIWLDQVIFDGAAAGETSGLIMHPSNGFRSTGKLELTLTVPSNPKESTMLNPSEREHLVGWFNALREYRNN